MASRVFSVRVVEHEASERGISGLNSSKSASKQGHVNPISFSAISWGDARTAPRSLYKCTTISVYRNGVRAVLSALLRVLERRLGFGLRLIGVAIASFKLAET